MHRFFNSALTLLAAATSLLGKAAEAKLVFAHYLVIPSKPIISRVSSANSHPGWRDRSQHGPRAAGHPAGRSRRLRRLRAEHRRTQRRLADERSEPALRLCRHEG